MKDIPLLTYCHHYLPIEPNRLRETRRRVETEHVPQRQMLRKSVHGNFLVHLETRLMHRVRFATRAKSRAAVFKLNEIVYHRERFHSALGYKSAVDLEMQLN